jgi:hypothetical protein
VLGELLEKCFEGAADVRKKTLPAGDEGFMAVAAAAASSDGAVQQLMQTDRQLQTFPSDAHLPKRSQFYPTRHGHLLRAGRSGNWIPVAARIRTRNPSNRAAVVRRLFCRSYLYITKVICICNVKVQTRHSREYTQSNQHDWNKENCTCEWCVR